MQRFLKWLGLKLFPKKQEPKLRQTGIIPRPKNSKRRDSAVIPEAPFVDFDSELQGRIADGGPGKNILVRNKYVREETGTHESLKIVDESIISIDEEDGFDPYNTGRFDRSRNWNSRTGK